MNNKIDIGRFLKRLDEYFNSNDLDGAGEYIKFWENEARNACDDRALLTILNEWLGFCRRVNDENKALSSVKETNKLIQELNLSNSLSAATIYTNAATTLTHFNKIYDGLELYAKAKKVFEDNKKTNTYEYASLLNNYAGALNVIKKYDEAEKKYLEAIEILKELLCHDGEIALSLIMLAHITFDKTNNPDDETYNKVENLLDEAVKYLTSDKIVRDGNFAYILTKCAPSFEYFKRQKLAKEMIELANDIYSKNK